MDQVQNAIVIYPSKWKFIALAAASCAFVAAGIWIATSPTAWAANPWKAAVAAYAGIPFFGYAFIYFILRLVRNQPVLVIDGEGIWDHASALSVGLIRWEEIDTLGPYDFRGQRLLGITLKESAAFLAKQSPLKRWILNLNTRLTHAPINIPQTSLPMSIQELLALITQYYGDKLDASRDQRSV